MRSQHLGVQERLLRLVPRNLRIDWQTLAATHKATLLCKVIRMPRVDNFVACAALPWRDPIRAGGQHKSFGLAGMNHLTSVPTD